ncbi:non-ribosomal peptide synthetase, partial [Microbulbifer epialgicus]
FNEGRENPLGPLSVQYADYAVWQREWLSGDVLAEQLGYWQEQLRGLPPVHSLPLDKTRPNKQSFIGARYCQTLNKGLTKSIQRFCRTRDVTLFMFIHSVLSILLNRYSNENDIVIGTPIAGRVHRDIESLIGFFANTLVLRSDLSGNLIFDELLQKNRQVVLDAYEYQDIPFEILVEALNPERNANHSPLFQVMLTLQNNGYSGLELGGLTFSGLHSTHCSTKYDLELSLIETEQGLILDWIYSKDLFEEPTIERFASSFRVLLEEIISSPERPINQLSILTELQKKQLLIEWNNTAIDYPKNICVPELFEQRVKESPNSIAVAFNDDVLSYKELDACSNKLASYLVEQCVKPNELVGLCIERSLDMVVALLGIMKAGCAYLPLDPSYPESRLHYMLQDAGVSIVLSQFSLKRLLKKAKASILFLDDSILQEELSSYSSKNILQSSIKLSPQSLAYVLYTSGSSGKPKGVMIEHAALTNFLFAMEDMLRGDLCSTTKMLAVTTAAFDMAILEIFGPLVSGGQIIIASQTDTKNPQLLSKLIEKHDINFMQATPITWQLLMDIGWKGKKDLVALSGGEVIGTKLVDYLSTQCQRLWNGYGPTETTVFTLIKEEHYRDYSLVLGRMLSNYKHYVLNDLVQPLPIGMMGELHIGGPGVARGYLNRPELTKEKFISNPFSSDPN